MKILGILLTILCLAILRVGWFKKKEEEIINGKIMDRYEFLLKINF